MSGKYGKVLSGAALGTLALAGSAQAEPWRLEKALNAPEGLSLSGSYRVRYEYLDGQFRAGASGADQILVERLLLGAEYDFGSFYVGAELQDSRAQLDDAGTPLGTDDVDAFELLRGYVGWRGEGVFTPKDKLDLAVGRLTIDLGSRRLVARNQYRNTANNYTGAHLAWSSGDTDVNAFFVLPVDRRPSDFTSLERNAVDLDEENTHVRFWSIYAHRKGLIGDIEGDLYLFGLQESDRPELTTTDRNLYTPGFRLFRKPKKGQLDFEIETAVQTGNSALSRAASAPRLEHLAHYHHAQVGYSFAGAWKPRLVLEYDFASGDRDPTDGRNGRFDTLFGARRFDYGPTGIFGPLFRSNLNAPGWRVTARPLKSVSLLFGHRAAFLAAGRDVLTTAGVRDATGASGNSIGHQLESSVRWDALPGNLQFEFGTAYLAKGRFLLEAPNASPDGDSFYGYSSVMLSF
ncbi:MAG: alginate export family protein [Hyphomonadaceae bacterium]|nr:alginate export family protein [Hyphomonadaceae bacterium]